jgi:protein TonB
MFAIRVPMSVVAGAVLSGALFLGLWQLVSVPFGVREIAEAKRIDFTNQRRDTPATNKRDPQVIREPPVVQLAGPRVIVDDWGDDSGIGYTAPQLTPQIERVALQTSGVDRDATPIVRMDPDYPAGAAARNTEGWVQVRFAVTTAGTVRDAVVIASEPGTIFDEAALKAVARWRYNPRVVDGVAVERVGLETVFRFELE